MIRKIYPKLLFQKVTNWHFKSVIDAVTFQRNLCGYDVKQNIFVSKVLSEKIGLVSIGTHLKTTKILDEH